MEILFEDNYIIVAVKPVGKLSELSGDEKFSFADELRLYRKNKNERDEIFALHRLDRAVGGVMVYAKTHFASSEISKQIANGEFKKEYLAVVHGEPNEKAGMYEDLLFKDSRKNKSFVVKRMRKGVKQARLSYEVLGTSDSKFEKVSLLKISLHTGRSHQIRVQLSSRKMPLVGDGKYGASDGCDIGLWSHSVEFSHPKTGEKMKFSSRPMGEAFDIFNINSILNLSEKP